MLNPLTILEVHDLILEANLSARGIRLSDVREFVMSHVYADAVYVARDDDGTLHGVALGWPVRDPVDYDGAYVDEPDGEVFYCNLLVTGTREGRPSAPEIAAVLKRRVCEKHPSVRYFCYHRAKHENRMKLYELERLERDG